MEERRSLDVCSFAYQRIIMYCQQAETSTKLGTAESPNRPFVTLRLVAATSSLQPTLILQFYGKKDRDPFPTGTTDIPPGIIIVIHSLFKVIAITAAHAAFAA
ncbi:Uncharacterized protein BM_BM17912 [Brugia malayi]|uniref:Uncharacterized protein n=1 Tax=Brugia malayi TaxID=6279 RepID=A0A4E9EU77_BRUMA|nr:Uncharacterized protein BM_BM17912 [Brugia malayi]VIO86354.1 Uncharacterized protein BM_BM17912 [Brugia malayi]